MVRSAGWQARPDRDSHRPWLALSLATLDTGAQTTDLYENFAKAFASLVNEAGMKDSTEVRGVSHAESFDSMTLPELKLNVGHLDVMLRPAHLKQGRAFKIDFTTMRLELEPNQ